MPAETRQRQVVVARAVEHHAAQVGPQPAAEHVDGRDEPGDEPEVCHAVQSADQGRGEQRRHQEGEAEAQREDPERHRLLEHEQQP